MGNLIEECNKVLTELDPKSTGVSRRQIFVDIQFMESSEGWSVELERLRDSKKVYYRYVDTSFSINNMPLNDVEINQLQSAVDILSHFKGMPQFEWIHELVPKLKQGFESKEHQQIIMEFDANEYLKGIENLGILHNAISYKKVLNIAYQPFDNDNSYDIILHPYYLKQYNNRWFVFGYNPDNCKYDWNLALDRVVHVNELSIPYNENSEIEWAEYFEDIIGVTKPINAKLEKIIIQFIGKTGKYIESKPIHGSQKTRWIDENTLELQLSLMINYEFERLVMSYADRIKIIEPQSLKNTIKQRIEKALQNNN